MTDIYLLAFAIEGDLETSLHPTRAEANAELWRVFASIAQQDAGETPGQALNEFLAQGTELLKTTEPEHFESELAGLLCDYPIDGEARISWKIQQHQLEPTAADRIHDLVSEAVESGRLNRDNLLEYDELVRLLAAQANSAPARIVLHQDGEGIESVSS